jgi:hypothetical protein
MADPRRRGWLYVLLGERLTASLEASVGAPWHEDHWVDRRLATRGFGAMPLALGWPETAAGRGRDILVWTVTQQLLLVSDAARQLGVSPAKSTLMTIQLRVLAGSVELDDPQPAGGRPLGASSQRDLCREIESRLAERALPSEHPLLDTPFHRFLVYTESRLVLRLAETLLRGDYGEATLARLHGLAAVVRLGIIESVQGLVMADGVLDVAERRLVRELIDLGRFSREETAALEEGIDELPTMARLAAQIRAPTQRALVLRVVIAASLIDHDRSADEDEYVDRLAEAFEIPIHEVARLHLEAATNLQVAPDLGDRLSRLSALERFNRSGGRRIERVVRQHLDALVVEAKQTGEIAQLLSKKANSDLSAAEQDRLEAALRDLIRAIPALAIFAAPGGAILLPILERILPFSLLPDSFRSQDEKRPKA